jgi:hypothetical protein
MKKVVSLLMAFVLVFSNISGTFASKDIAPYSEAQEDFSGEVQVSFSGTPSDDDWYIESGVVTIEFPAELGAGNPSVHCTESNGESTALLVESREDGSYVCTSEYLPDGVHTFYVSYEGSEGEEITGSYSFKVDTAPVSALNVVPTGISFRDSVVYAGSSYTLSGFYDLTSGIRYIETYDAEGLVETYVEDFVIEIYDGIEHLVLKDIAGNEATVYLQELLPDVYGKVIFDGEMPSASVSIDNDSKYVKDGFLCYDSGVSVNMSVEDTNLSIVTVSVNGVELDSGVVNTSSVSETYEFSDNGVYEFVVEALDKTGNSVSKALKFIIDTSAPEKGTLKCTGTWQKVSGSIHTTGMDIIGEAFDSLTGIYSVEVLCNSEVVATSLPYSIAQSGEYRIRVTDNVGNFSEVSLADILGVQSSYIVLDKDAPFVSIMPMAPANENANGYWYTSVPDFMITASDDSIKFVRIEMVTDGKTEVVYYGDASLVEHVIQTNDSTGSSYTLVVTAEDIFGNTVSKEFGFFIDSASPYIVSADAPTPNSEKGGVVYYKDTFDVVLNATDDGFGGVFYYLDGVKNSTGVFTGIGEGEHFVQIEDGLGNKSDKIPLSDLLEWSSNYVKIVSEGSVISASPYNGTWVNSVSYYPIVIFDEVGIDSYSISVDGLEVMSEHYAEADVEDCNILLKLSDHIISDGKHSIEIVVVSNAGITTTYTDTICLDTSAPTVNGFEFQGIENAEGSCTNGSDKYSFFLNGAGNVIIEADDGENSSGVYSVFYKFEGYEWVECLTEGRSYIEVPVPNGFKGKLEAYATDLVGNKGSINNPDLIVSEDESAHTGASSIGVVLPSTPYADINGLPLYNDYIEVEIIAGCPISGVASLGWGISGVSEYSEDFTPVLYEKNLIVKASHTVPVLSIGNGIKFVTSFTDGVGHTSEYAELFSIDKTAPVVNVEYSVTNDNEFYNSDRVAYISISDDNFNPAGFVLSGTYGTIGEWVQNGTDWSNTITFSEEGVYSFVIECSDLAENKCEKYLSGEFIVDKTSPVISRVDDCQETANGWYSYAPELLYNISDDYFKSYAVYVNGSEVGAGQVPDVRVLTEEYLNQSVEVKVIAQDMAGNVAETVYRYAHDNSAPVDIKVECVSPSAEKGGNVYFNAPFTVSVSASDGEGYGHIVYKLEDKISASGEFTVDANGGYTVTIQDGLGNTEIIPLEDLCGWNGSNVIINSVNPVVECHKYHGVWVPSMKPYSIRVSSGVGIDSLVVSVNGTEVVNNVYLGTNTQSLNVDANIIDAPINADLSYNISVTVVDNSGLSTVVTDTVYLDTVKPGMGSLNVSGSWELHDGFVYIKSPVTISGLPEDYESGLSDVSVYKDGEYAGVLPYNIHESGEYAVVAVDAVGNRVEFLFSDIAGIESNKVIWDDTLPVVYFDSEKSDSHIYFDGENYWYKNNPVIYIGMSDENLSSVSVTVTVDGSSSVVVDNIIEDGIYAINTNYAVGTHFKIVASARDKSGSVVSDSYEFKVDTSKPDIGSLAAVADPYKAENSSAVYTKGYFHISGCPSDVGSGIKEVFVVKDGVATKYSNTLDVLLNTEELSGDYMVKVVDNVGNVTEIPVAALLGTKSSNLVVDHTVPVISRVDSNNETKPGWYNYSPVLAYNVYDSYIKSYEVSVNGEVVVSGNSSEDITIDMSKYSNMYVTLELSVNDWAGNTSKYSYSYTHDNTPPKELGIGIESPTAFKDSFVYYNNSIDVVLTASDAIYGDISYYVNGKKVGSSLVISESGEYYLEAVDGLGNATGRIRFADLLGWSGNHIVIDSKKPEIQSNSYNNEWIAGVGTYNIKVSDNVGLHHVSVEINGNELVSDSILDTDCSSKSYSVNTSMVSANTDGSYSVLVKATDNSGLVSTWADTVYIDNTAPVVDDFEVINDVLSLNTTGGYGHFFNGNGSVKVVCSDSLPSCGITSIWTRFEGYEWVEHKLSGASSVTVSIPADFKGTFEAYAVDQVGNAGSVRKPAKLVSETSKNHINTHILDIVMPDTPYVDVDGLPLYNSDISANVSVGCSWSGLKSFEWSIDDVNHVSSLNGGAVEENIVVGYSDVLELSGNANGMRLSVHATDNSGYIFSSEYDFSIDKDAPVIAVSYDSFKESGYYNYTRIATVSIRERNFNPSNVIIEGVSGELGSWKYENGVWVCNIVFSVDGDYQFTINCTDRAGNKSAQYSSEKFTVDKTSPAMSVSWNSASAENGMYYNSSRVAVITVIETNFNPDMVVVDTMGKVGNWSTDGNKHTLNVVYDSDGVYTLSVSAKDKAGNSAVEAYISESFIIDLTYPEVTISRVSDGVSYKSDLEFIVTVKDAYVNKNTRVYLSGKSHDTYEVTGQFKDGSAVFSYDNFPQSVDVDDVYYLKVVAVDNAGNTVEKAMDFSVNRFGSSYEFDALALLNNYVRTVNDIVIYEVNVDKLDLSNVDVVVHRDGKPVQLSADWVSMLEEDTGAKYLYTYSISKDAFMEDGKYSISIMSESFDGTKYTSASEQYVFVVDKSAPDIIISGVEEGKTYNEYERVVVLDVRDPSGISSLTVKVNGEEVSNISNEDDLYSFVVQEKDSEQSIVVEAIDLAGNKSVSKVSNVLITSNIMVYLINQEWVRVCLVVVAVVVLALIIALLLSRRKERSEEEASVIASGEVYRSSTGGSSGGSSGESSGQVATGTPVTSFESSAVPEGYVGADEAVTSVLDETETGVM